MRINGPAGPIGAASASSTRRTGGSSFTLPQEEAATHTAPTAATRMAAGIDALLALQGVDDPAERRRRSVARGRTALDALEQLKLALLAGSLDSATLGRLKAAAAGLNEPSGDPRLDGVLAEIDLRVEVELAKMDSKAG